jgi:hypothetical protein
MSSLDGSTRGRRRVRRRSGNPVQEKRRRSGWSLFCLGRDGSPEPRPIEPPPRLHYIPPSPHPSLPRLSSREELKEIEDRLLQGLTSRKVAFDPARSTATSMVDDLFASHDSGFQYSKSLENKLDRQQADLQSYEAEITSARESMTRLRHDYRALTVTHSHEVAALRHRCSQDIAALQQQLQNQDDQHKIVVDGLRSNHQMALNDKDITYTDKISRLEDRHQFLSAQREQAHREEVDQLKRDHSVAVCHEREKVRQVEEDMRMSADQFVALRDDELRGGFYKLIAEIESLSRLQPAPDFLQCAQSWGVNIRLPPNLPARGQKLLLRSVLWSIIVEGVFSTPFRAFGTYGDHLYETWTTLFAPSQDPLLDGWPRVDALAEKWRYATVDRLQRTLMASTENMTQSSQLEQSKNANITGMAAQLATLFSPGSNDTQTLFNRLQAMLDNASGFAISIALERCRVRVFVPPATRFLGSKKPRDCKDVKDVHPGDEAEIPFGDAEFVVAPGLSKEGNARGGKLDDRMVLTKAMVYFTLKEPVTD